MKHTKKFSLIATLMLTAPLAWAQATSGVPTDTSNSPTHMTPAQMQPSAPAGTVNTMPSTAPSTIAPAPTQIQPPKDPLVERREQRREARQEYRETKKAAKAERKAAKKAADAQAEAALGSTLAPRK